MLPLTIRQATAADAPTVSEILTEAARWLEHSGMPLWKERELEPEKIFTDVASGLFFLGEISGEPVATLKFQLEDPLFWPDAPADEAAYVHRLAVKRSHAGKSVSASLLSWAATRTKNLGRRYLRLDCTADCLKLRALYESFGFRHRDDRQVGSYFVSRYELDLSAKGLSRT
jgi:GNAT superfamily N-acetyltransferase